MPSITIIGNCQAPALAQILRLTMSDKFIIDSWPEVHLISESNLPSLYNNLCDSDIIMVMPIGDDYRGMRLGTNQIFSECREEALKIVYPNLYFDAYYPFFGYLRDSNGSHITSSTHQLKGNNPFGDYHDIVALRYLLSHQGDSCTPSGYLGYLDNVSVFAQSVIAKYLSSSLLELQRREASCSFNAHTFIEDSYRNQLLFHSFNHPSNALLGFIANELCKLVCLDPRFSSGDNISLNHQCGAELSEFLGVPQLPIHHSVSSSLNLAFAQSSIEDLLQVYQRYFEFAIQNVATITRSLSMNIDGCRASRLSRVLLNF